MLSLWIVRYVEKLVAVIFFIGDAICVISFVPDFARVVFADGEGKATFNELGGAFDCDVRCGG